MKRITIYFMLLLFLFLSAHTFGFTQNINSIVEKISLQKTDVPDGFMFGLIPEGAKKTLKDNPWILDKAAIEKLTDKIYPGGDFNQISGIHITILANKETPHRDDIVCYIIQYKNTKAARDEITKISEYVRYNQDRAFFHAKDDYIVFLFADDINNFSLLKELDNKIAERIEKN